MCERANVVLVSIPRQAGEHRALHDLLCAAGVRPRLAFDLTQLSDGDAPDVVILAPGVHSDVDDFDAIDRVRRNGYQGLIFVIGRNADSAAAARALDGGADDYVPVCCDSAELIARVRALVRRAGASAVLQREVDGLVLDLRRSVVRSGDVEVALTRRETDLLEYLARHAGHPVSREQLAAHIWHTSTPNRGGTNIVDVYVSYLRRKLGTLGRQSIIRSVRGVGYELRLASYTLRAADARAHPATRR
jgi:DNA-binding response OmpR family regulator